jgi:hypothetical protein
MRSRIRCAGSPQIAPGAGPVVGPGSGGLQEPQPQGGAPAPPQPSTVQFSFDADRNKLYAAWQALANLADLCGKLTVSVKGEAPQNLDKSKLENGVYEPLRDLAAFAAVVREGSFTKAVAKLGKPR